MKDNDLTMRNFEQQCKKLQGGFDKCDGQAVNWVEIQRWCLLCLTLTWCAERIAGALDSVKPTRR